jgi:cytosine/adenosine deaminase-related metal-dependent hydrolase
MTVLRGVADDLPLLEWLTTKIFPAEAKHVSEEYVADGTRLAAAEMIRSGTTCFNDMYFFPEVQAGVVQEVGIRAKYADSRQQTADSRQQTADSRQQTADSRQQTADGWHQTAAAVAKPSAAGQPAGNHYSMPCRSSRIFSDALMVARTNDLPVVPGAHLICPCLQPGHDLPYVPDRLRQ